MAQITKQNKLLSLVLPCYNEEAVILEMHKQLTANLAQLDNIDYELIYIDDGSNDATLSLLINMAKENEQVRVLSLSRNFGHQIAVTAGLEHTSGDAVILIDADLQDPSELIQEMINRWQEGVEVVYGIRKERLGESSFKRGTAAAFYRLLNRISDIPIPLDTGDFRLMDRKVVNALLSMPERDRFVRGMVAWVGFRQEPLPYTRSARHAGITKYSPSKMLRFALDGIFSFSSVPLRLATWMGLATASLSVLGIFYALALRLATDIWVPGWTLLFIAILFIGGIQLLFLGIIGEYLSRVYGEVKQRPLYVLKDSFGFKNSSK